MIPQKQHIHNLALIHACPQHIPTPTHVCSQVMESKLRGLAVYIADLLYRRSSPEHSRHASSSARGSVTASGNAALLGALALNAGVTGFGGGAAAAAGGGGMFASGRGLSGTGGGMFGGGGAGEDRRRGAGTEANNSPAKRQRLLGAFQKEEENTAHVG